MACCFDGLKRKKEWQESFGTPGKWEDEIVPEDESPSFRFWASSLMRGNFQMRVWITLFPCAIWLFFKRTGKGAFIADFEPYVFWVLGIGMSVLLAFKLRVALGRYDEARGHVSSALSDIRSTISTLLACYDTCGNQSLENDALVEDMFVKIEGFFWAMVYCLKDREEVEVPKKWANTEIMKTQLEKASSNQWILYYALLMKADLKLLRQAGVLTPHMHGCFESDIDSLCASFYGALKIATTPFPFPYDQLMSTLVHVFCYGVTIIVTYLFDIFGIFASVLTSFIFLGLDHVAEELMDPFGDDVVDLAIIRLASGLSDDLKNFRSCMHVNDDGSTPEQDKE